MAELERYPWPGNVRELENVIQGILVLKEHGHIEVDDVRHKLGGRSLGLTSAPSPGSGVRLALPEHGLDLKDTLDRLEKDLIREALCRSNGNRARAASLLGLNRTTLVEKLRRWPTPGSVADALALVSDQSDLGLSRSANG